MQDLAVSDPQPAPSDFKGFPPGFNPRLVTPKREVPGHVGYSPDFKAAPPPLPANFTVASVHGDLRRPQAQGAGGQGTDGRRGLAPLLTHVKDWPEEQARELAALAKVAGLMQKLEGLSGGPLGFRKPIVRIDWSEDKETATVMLFCSGGLDYRAGDATIEVAAKGSTWAQATALALEAAWDAVP